MLEPPPPNRRLDSWKAIADYLGRDLATVRRWEKSLGLPVHRVAGTGRSVFAYTSEVDAWLRNSKASESTVASATPAAAVSSHTPWPGLALGVAMLLLVIGLVAWSRPDPFDLQIEVTGGGLVARDTGGAEQWRYPFPGTYKTELPGAPLFVAGGDDPSVYVATAYRVRHGGDGIEGGALTVLDRRGHLRRSFSFDDVVTFGGQAFGAPWAVMSFAVDDAVTPNRIAVAAHHYTWNPGLVTVLDGQWRRRGTFVHAGWIEAVRWVGADRLVIGGFSNAHDGGMAALLDSNALDGQGPEPAGSRHHCESCGNAPPLRMFVFPRSEVNIASASPFNRVLLVTTPGRVSVRTVEMPSADGAADAHYEFTPALDLVSAQFSERYWEQHRALEAGGKLTHTRADCPDREGPRHVKVWEAATGWRLLATR